MALRVLILLAVLFFCFADVSTVEGEMAGDVSQVVVKAANKRLMQTVDCGGQCDKRCSVHSRPNLCKRACGTCCVRCKCVPPGTSGNREMCGSCYMDMKTHGNKTKCP